MISIFVFGSNEAGCHGKGAALNARLHHGAIYGQGVGPQGTSFAIPTKSHHLRALPIEGIEWYVSMFKEYARRHQYHTFNVTRIGCGLAGFRDQDIAPMFADAPRNCRFSTKWAKWLPNHESWTDQ